jgi:phosphatidylethanolamine/phosphatidyl-N-methylethanolamine N-methyltransferase
MLETEKVTEVYSRYSKFYDAVFGRVFHETRLDALRYLEIAENDHILEVGVGTGISLPFYPRNCRVTGIDLTGPMLDRGLARIQRLDLEHIELRQMDARHMAFPDDTFDSVMAAYVMTAVPSPRKVLSEMSRVCRPGGRIVLLNHFANHHPIVSRFERKISPFCSKIGFRTDLTVEDLMEGSSLRIERRLRVKPFRFWQVIQCVNEKESPSGVECRV